MSAQKQNKKAPAPPAHYWGPQQPNTPCNPYGTYCQSLPPMDNQVFMPFYNDKLPNHQPLPSPQWGLGIPSQSGDVQGAQPQEAHDNKDYLTNMMSPTAAVRALTTGAITQALMCSNTIFDPLIGAKLGALIGGLTIVEQHSAEETLNGMYGNGPEVVHADACCDIQVLQPPDDVKSEDFLEEPDIKRECWVCP